MSLEAAGEKIKEVIFLFISANGMMSSARRTICSASVIILFSAMPAFGQKEANYWPLGPSAGVTFKEGPPAKWISGNTEALMVVSVVSDADGNLLLYTDGSSVWDRRHVKMPNGNDLKGGRYQSESLIVPKPGDPSQYFIFTTRGDGWGAPREAAHYSTVDLCLNNGLGDVVTASKNTPLMGIAATRTAAVKHANGIDYWVALHKWESDDIYCYRVTAEGVSRTAVISNTGVYLGYTSNSTGDGGEMKFSPDGRKLAMAISQSATVVVYDFDSQTGTVSNPLVIPPMYRQNFYTPDYTGSVEFSPDGRKLYMNRTLACLLLQYDLAAGDKSAVLKTRTILAGDTLQHINYDYYVVGGLQLGPDGKIYLTWVGRDNSGISVIAKPEGSGVQCDYKHDLFSWPNTNFTYETFPRSLPAFVSSYFNPSAAIQNDFNCFSPTVGFSLTYPHGKAGSDVEEIHWEFDDSASGVFNESNEISPSHTFVGAGLHNVRATVTWKDGTATRVHQLLTIPSDVIDHRLSGLGNDTTICRGESLRIDASDAGTNIIWQDGSTNNYIDVTNPGIYWATFCRGGCIATDSIKVNIEDPTDILPADTLLCGSAELVLNEESFDEVIGWQDGSVSPVYSVTKPGLYWVKVRTNNCTVSDTVDVSFCKEDILIPNVITANGDGYNDYFEINGLDSNEWSLTIFNRAGRIIYYSGKYANDWSGSNLAAGVYYYSLNHNLRTQSYKGWIRLTR